LKKITKVISIIGLIAVMALSVPFITGCDPEVKTVTAITTKTAVSTSFKTVTSTATETVNNTITSTSTKTETSISTITETVQLISVTDDAGVTYTFEGPVDSLISLAPSITEIVYFAGADDLLIGRTDYCNYPEEVSDVASIGGYYSPDIELIVSLDPDVVLADSIQVDNGDVAYLQSLGMTVIVIDSQNIDDILDNILLVGEITGNLDTAAEGVAGLRARIDAVVNTIASANISDEDKPGVLHVTWYDPLWTIGQGSFLNIVIEMAGGINIFSDISDSDFQADLEQAVSRNPDIITIVSDHGSETSYYYVLGADSPFAETTAYINGAVYIVDSDIVCRPGPRIVDALELYAKLLYPDLFN
jgi:iron complex transport system substrate-binding protein